MRAGACEAFSIAPHLPPKPIRPCAGLGGWFLNLCSWIPPYRAVLPAQARTRLQVSSTRRAPPLAARPRAQPAVAQKPALGSSAASSPLVLSQDPRSLRPDAAAFPPPEPARPPQAGPSSQGPFRALPSQLPDRPEIQGSLCVPPHSPRQIHASVHRRDYRETLHLYYCCFPARGEGSPRRLSGEMLGVSAQELGPR